MISVAGMQGMTAVNNTDYAATKAALTAFYDSLRQEIIMENKNASIFNIYPYLVDTRLFDGFSGRALWIIPALKKEEVARRVVGLVCYGGGPGDWGNDVYLPFYVSWLGIAMMVVREIS